MRISESMTVSGAGSGLTVTLSPPDGYVARVDGVIVQYMETSGTNAPDGYLVAAAVKPFLSESTFDELAPRTAIVFGAVVPYGALIGPTPLEQLRNAQYTLGDVAVRVLPVNANQTTPVEGLMLVTVEYSLLRSTLDIATQIAGVV